jgi:hypothetical protein
MIYMAKRTFSADTSDEVIECFALSPQFDEVSPNTVTPEYEWQCSGGEWRAVRKAD